jgi:hypothetical protein
MQAHCRTFPDAYVITNRSSLRSLKWGNVRTNRLIQHQAARLRDLIQQRYVSQQRANRLERELFAVSDRLQQQGTTAAVWSETHAQYVRAIEERPIPRSFDLAKKKGLRGQLAAARTRCI